MTILITDDSLSGIRVKITTFALIEDSSLLSIRNKNTRTYEKCVDMYMISIYPINLFSDLKILKIYINY